MRSVKLLEIVQDNATVTVGTYQSLLVLVFHREVDQSALSTAEAVQRTLLARFPKGPLVLTVIASDVPLPAEGTRAMVVDSFRRMAAKNAAAATTVIGDGFWASAMRSTLTALNLVVRPPCPQRTFANVADALAWLSEYDASLTTPGLAREIAGLHSGEAALKSASGSGRSNW